MPQAARKYLVKAPLPQAAREIKEIKEYLIAPTLQAAREIKEIKEKEALIKNKGQK